MYSVSNLNTFLREMHYLRSIFCKQLARLLTGNALCEKYILYLHVKNKTKKKNKKKKKKKRKTLLIIIWRAHSVSSLYTNLHELHKLKSILCKQLVLILARNALIEKYIV